MLDEYNLKGIILGDEPIGDWMSTSDIKYDYGDGFFKRDWNPQDTVGCWNWNEHLCDFIDGAKDGKRSTFKVVMNKRDDPESLGLTQNIKVGGKIFGRFGVRETSSSVHNIEHLSQIHEFSWAQEESGDETLNLNNSNYGQVQSHTTSQEDETTFGGFYGATGAAIGATAALTFFMMRKQQKASIDVRDEDCFHRV